MDAKASLTKAQRSGLLCRNNLLSAAINSVLTTKKTALRICAQFSKRGSNDIARFARYSVASRFLHCAFFLLRYFSSKYSALHLLQPEKFTNAHHAMIAMNSIIPNPAAPQSLLPSDYIKQKLTLRAMFAVVVMMPVAMLIAMPMFFVTQPLSAQQFDLSPGKKVIISDSVFRRGSAVVEQASIGEFDKLAKYIQARPELEFEIRGHSSNEGSPERNLRLSEERAIAAKNYLVRYYGISPNRIRTRGVGDTQPMVPNVDEASRSRNRRVEFIGISGVTQRSLTTDNNTALEGEGRLTVVQNRVLIKAPWETDFQVAELNAPIYEYHKISTGPGARAEIRFRSGQKFQIGENSSAIVYSIQKNRPQDKPQETVELVSGDMFLKLKQGNAIDEANQLSVRTAGKQLTLGEGAAKIGIDSASRQTSISILEGTARLRGSEDSSALDIGESFGAQVGTTGQATKRPLPNPPKLMEPDPKLLALVPVPAPLTFKWMNTSFRTRLEVAATDDFLNPVYKTTTNSDSALVKLPPGKYFFRLASVDSTGLESKAILFGFTIAQLEERGVFRWLPYGLFIVAVAFVWASMLFNTPFQSRALLSWTIQNNTLQFQFANADRSQYEYRWLSKLSAVPWLQNLSVNHQFLIKTLRSAATLCIISGLLLLLR